MPAAASRSATTARATVSFHIVISLQKSDVDQIRRAGPAERLLRESADGAAQSVREPATPSTGEHPMHTTNASNSPSFHSIAGWWAPLLYRFRRLRANDFCDSGSNKRGLALLQERSHALAVILRAEQLLQRLTDPAAE